MIGLFVPLLPLADVKTLRPPEAMPAHEGWLEVVAMAAIVLVSLFLLWSRDPRRMNWPTRGSGRPGPRRKVVRPGPRLKAFRPQREKKWILVDGSNVMHWEDNTPHIEPVRRVVSALKAQGLDPGVVFDANVGWKLVGRYLGERELGQILDLPPDQVLVVPKGSPADPWLLTTARDFSARIVTNDRFRDWTEEHPEITTPGFLVRGSLTGGGVWLEGMGGPGDRTGA